MSIHTQLLQYLLLRTRVAHAEDHGEVSATTVIWAAVLITAAIAAGIIVVQKIEEKAAIVGGL